MIQHKIGLAIMIMGGIWAGLVAIGFVGMTAVAFFRLVSGNPEGEGIVMLPVVLIFASLIAAPGVGLFFLGRFLMRRSAERHH